MMMPSIPLTYKRGKSLQAAYSHMIRVGYIEERANGRWLWQLSLLQPNGGHYMAKCDSEDDAKRELEEAFYHWTREAGLTHDK